MTAAAPSTALATIQPEGGLIYSVGADLPLTIAQLMAIADSATGG